MFDVRLLQFHLLHSCTAALRPFQTKYTSARRISVPSAQTYRTMHTAYRISLIGAIPLFCNHTATHSYIYTHKGCPGRNVPDFGRMFLKLKWTDITKNTYIQSWTVTEIMAREKFGLLRFHVLYLVHVTYYLYTAHVCHSVYSRVKRIHAATAHVKCLES